MVWCIITDVEEERQGPNIELHLGGIARDLVREIPIQYKIQGGTVDMGDGSGPQQVNGAAFLLHALSERFAPLEEENNLTALADLHGFARLPGESIDTVLTRFEVVVQRARTRSGIPLSEQHAAWHLLLALKLRTETWVQLLQPTMGRLPRTALEYRRFTEYIKRFGHLTETSNQTTRGPTQGQYSYPTADNTNMFGYGNNNNSSPMYNPLPGISLTANSLSNDWNEGEWDDSDTSDEEEAQHIYPVDDGETIDMTGWSDNAIGAYYYQKYKFFKRKWRTHNHKPARFNRGSGKGGKGGPRRKILYETNQHQDVVLFGKGGKFGGKGGKSGSQFRRGNPIGKDGNPLKCDRCGSE